MSDLEELIGKSVVAVESDRESWVRFVLEGGGSLLYAAQGDCCSHAYLQHMANVPAIIGGTVRSVEDNVQGVDTDDGYDVVDQYMYTIHTDRGSFQVEMRLEHNGYYGGWLQLWHSDPECELKPVTEDW